MGHEVLLLATEADVAVLVSMLSVMLNAGRYCSLLWV